MKTAAISLAVVSTGCNSLSGGGSGGASSGSAINLAGSLSLSSTSQSFKVMSARHNPLASLGKVTDDYISAQSVDLTAYSVTCVTTTTPIKTGTSAVSADGSFAVDIAFNNKTLSVFTTLQFVKSTDKWVDTCISDGSTLKPIYRSSYNKDNVYVIKYSNEVTGYYYNKKTKQRTTIQEPVTGGFFDNYAYPYFLGSLPLTAGYKKDLSVFDYKPENKSNISKTRIEEVKNNIYVSNLSGEHKVWQVSVFEEASNDDIYLIKNILEKGVNIHQKNKEGDTPIKIANGLHRRA